MLIARRGPGLQLFVGAVVFGFFVIGERWRYRRKLGDDAAHAGFEPTGERYRDPSTGYLMAVEYDPRTGVRRYVKSRRESVQK